MNDREKIIKGLEELYGFLFREYANIPAEESKIYYERTCAIHDAIALLKEQEAEIERLQPKKGKWLEYAGDQKCSMCGSSYSDLWPEYDRTPFCPHCGAKMEGR